MLGYTRQAMSSPVVLHGKSLLLGLVLLASLGAVIARNTHRGTASASTIVVEHDGGLSVRIACTVKQGSSLITLALSGKEQTAFLSMPDSWKLTHAKGTPITGLTESGSALGFRRIGVPTGTALTFFATSDMGVLTVLNPKTAPLDVAVERVDLDRAEVTRVSKLFTDPQAVFQ